MTATELVIAGLATWQAVEIWRKSELFAGSRAGLELYDDFLSRLLLCPWCLSVWVGLLSVLVLSDPPEVTSLWRWALAALLLVLRVCVYALAASRLANTLHDVHRLLSDWNSRILIAETDDDAGPGPEGDEAVQHSDAGGDEGVVQQPVPSLPGGHLPDGHSDLRGRA